MNSKQNIFIIVLILLLVNGNVYSLPVVLPEQKQFGEKRLKKKFDLHTYNCNAGYSHHCVALASMYYSGIEVAQDYAKAIQLFNYSCKHGNANGCYLLARMYYQGIGTTKNIKDGLILFNKACRLGMNIACDEYRKVVYRQYKSR